MLSIYHLLTRVHAASSSWCFDGSVPSENDWKKYENASAGNATTITYKNKKNLNDTAKKLKPVIISCMC